MSTTSPFENNEIFKFLFNSYQSKYSIFYVEFFCYDMSKGKYTEFDLHLLRVCAYFQNWQYVPPLY